jgi:outer membrane protein assembly factor BamB
VYALDARTGKAKEIARLGLEPVGRAAVSRGVLYLGEPDNLAALDATTGKTLWVAPTGYGQIVPTEEALYVSGWPRALDPKTGKVQWRIESGRGSWDILLAGELLLCGLSDDNGQNARVCALERKSGKERWRFPLDGKADPVPWLTLRRAGDKLVFAARTDEGHLLDLKSGREVRTFGGKWPSRPESTQSYPSHVICATQAVVRFRPPAGPGARGDLIFLTCNDGLYVFRAGNGELRFNS